MVKPLGPGYNKLLALLGVVMKNSRLISDNDDGWNLKEITNGHTAPGSQDEEVDDTLNHRLKLIFLQ